MTLWKRWLGRVPSVIPEESITWCEYPGKNLLKPSQGTALGLHAGAEGTWASPTARLGNAISPGSLGRTRRGAWLLWLSSCLQILEARPTTIDWLHEAFRVRTSQNEAQISDFRGQALYSVCRTCCWITHLKLIWFYESRSPRSFNKKKVVREKSAHH